MKILVVGDLHFRRELPYSGAISDGRRGEWEAVKKTIHEAAKGCKMVVLMGDSFNSRNNHSSVLTEFVEFLNGFPDYYPPEKLYGKAPPEDTEIHILAGNHEQYLGGTALDFLERMDIPNWHIHTLAHTTYTKVLDKERRIAFVPYLKIGDEEIFAYLERQGHFDVLFAHNVASTAKGWVAEEFVFPTEWLKKHSDMTFYGHNHNEEVISNRIQGTGSCFTHSTGEHERAIWTYDTDTKVTTRIPLPVRGIYSVNWSDSTYYDLPTNSIVKCYVTVEGTDLELVKNTLSRFDGGLVIENYMDQRKKVHFETGALDLSPENLLQKYAEAKGIPINDLMEGYNLLK